MELVSLHIKDFKNLKDITVDFSKHQNLSLLIGNNGSGKSNILEAIAEILEVGTLGKTCEMGSFELKYEISDKQYELNDLKASPHNQYPSKIVAIYSGEDQKLWQDCFRDPYLMRYKAIRENKPEIPQIYYFDRSFWEVALLTLALSELPDNQSFLCSTLGIYNFSKVYFHCNCALRSKWGYSGSANTILQFYDWLNHDNQPEIMLSIDDLKKSLSGFENDFFANLSNCISLEKENLIKYISIEYQKSENGPILRAEDLSEGEKKLLLLRAVFEFATDEESLVLLDEPDAHVHEARKMEIVKLVQEYADHGRACVMTTHSAKIADGVPLSHIVMLDTDKDGYSIVVNKEKQEMLGKLWADNWNPIQCSSLLDFNNALVLFEGQTDVKYVKRAILTLKSEWVSTIDVLQFNGTGNAFEFVDELRKCLPEAKKIIVVFDRDKAGSDGLAKCLGKKDDDKKNFSNNFLTNTKTYLTKNIYYFMLPIPVEQKAKNGFMIEDYFPVSVKRKILKETLKKCDGSLKTIPSSLDKTTKTEIENLFDKKDPIIVFDAFRILVEKIEKILDGTEKTEPVTETA